MQHEQPTYALTSAPFTILLDNTNWPLPTATAALRTWTRPEADQIRLPSNWTPAWGRCTANWATAIHAPGSLNGPTSAWKRGRNCNGRYRLMYSTTSTTKA